MNINELIQKKRKEMGISQRELGRRIRKSGQFISLIEKGTNNPSMGTLLDIFEALEISKDELIANNETNLNTNRMEIFDAMNEEIKIAISENEKLSCQYEQKIDDLYSKYFSKLFYWKTSKMTITEYFEFILSLSPSDEVSNITELDIKELSVIFARLLKLKESERYSIDISEKSSPGYAKKYEQIFFLNIPK